MELTIGRLAKRYRLSRSTLLYYDSIGLLSPDKRGSGNYRLYTEEDCRRLDQIALYRQAGLPLRQIGELLNAEHSDVSACLEAKISEINQQIAALRAQQRLIISLLQDGRLLEKMSILPKDALVSLLNRAGIGEQEQDEFHRQFEKDFPEQHQSFLEHLGASPEEIAVIRERYRS